MPCQQGAEFKASMRLVRVEGVSARHDINCQLFPVSVDVHPAFGAAESDYCPW